MEQGRAEHQRDGQDDCRRHVPARDRAAFSSLLSNPQLGPIMTRNPPFGRFARMILPQLKGAGLTSRSRLPAPRGLTGRGKLDFNRPTNLMRTVAISPA